MSYFRGILSTLTPGELFKLHPKLRWAAFSADGQVVFCEMRTGIESYTSDEDDRAFMQFGPLIMSGVAERLTHSGGAGKLQSVLVNMDKDSVLLMKFRNGFLALSVNRNEAFGVFQDIDARLRELA